MPVVDDREMNERQFRDATILLIYDLVPMLHDSGRANADSSVPPFSKYNASRIVVGQTRRKDDRAAAGCEDGKRRLSRS